MLFTNKDTQKLYFTDNNSTAVVELKDGSTRKFSYTGSKSGNSLEGLKISKLGIPFELDENIWIEVTE